MADYTCYSSTSNPTGETPPANYKIYICGWNGVYPTSFSGTWYCTSPGGMCTSYPTTPTAVTFTRPSACATNYLPPVTSPAIPFNIIITDPLVPNGSSAHDQALAIAVTGIVPADPYGTPDAGTTCSLGGIFLGYSFSGMCTFRLEITGVTF